MSDSSSVGPDPGRQSSMRRAHPSRSELWTIAALILGAAGYRPISLWAENNWDLGSPGVLVGIFLVLTCVQGVVLLAAIKAGSSRVPATSLIATTTLVLVTWDALPPGPHALWLGVLSLGGYWAARLLGPRVATAAMIFFLVFAGAPLAQVVINHVRESQTYPTTDLMSPEEATATGHVEDVLIVVVDSYPSLKILEDWFEHDVSSLSGELLDARMEVIESAWSHHTFTGLAIPSMMQLETVIDAGPTGPWGNLNSVYDIVRGESFVAGALQSAGFVYTHIESGWDGGTCGPSVDRCIGSGWVNEASWAMLEPTVVDTWMTSTYGHHHLVTTKNTVASLVEASSEVGDGELDYIYAHLLLPHAPIVADSGCKVALELPVATEFDPVESEQASMRAYLPQIQCVDRLLSKVIEIAEDDTAILITADHGMATQGQLRRSPGSWTDSEIAERLGVLLAYRLPSPCGYDSVDTNIEAMRDLVDCALGRELSLPVYEERHVIGSQDPVLVEKDRMERIKTLIANGVLSPGQDQRHPTSADTASARSSIEPWFGITTSATASHSPREG